MRRTTWRGLLLAILALLLALAWVAGRAGWLSRGLPRGVLTLYCFSTLQDVMEERLLPEFQGDWHSEHGQRVEFAVTYAGSGESTGLLMRRLPAEIAIVVSEIDAHRLPVPFESWRELPPGGILARTPMVIVVREENPLGITGFADLARPGIEVVHSDPEVSGAAMLAVLAEYRAALEEEAAPEGAVQLVTALWKNVQVPGAQRQGGSAAVRRRLG